MDFDILEVGEPIGKRTEEVLDTRLYKIKALSQNGCTLRITVPVCFGKKAIKKALEDELWEVRRTRKPAVKVGDVL